MGALSSAYVDCRGFIFFGRVVESRLLFTVFGIDRIIDFALCCLEA